MEPYSPQADSTAGGDVPGRRGGAEGARGQGGGGGRPH